MDRPLGVDIRYTSEETLKVSDDIELYYELQGDEGPHITLVNNFFIIAPIWRNYIADLAKKNRVLTYDLRNQGASSLKADLDWDDHVTDLLALLDGLGIEKTYLVGTSTSAFVCRDFAARYPERVSGLIMVGPSCTPSDGLKRRATERACINSLANGGTAALWDHLYSLVFAEDAMRAMGAAGYLGLREAFTAIHPAEPLLANLKAALQAAEGPELLARIKVPTLLLLGDQDPLWHEGNAAEAGRLIEDSTTVWLKGVGHLPYMEDSDGFQGAIQNFLDQLARRDAEVAPESRATTAGAEDGADPVVAKLCDLLRIVVADRTDLPETGLADTPLSSIGLESWAFTQLLGHVEEAFGIEWDMDVPTEVFDSLATIADYLHKHHATAVAAVISKEENQ
ncbi:alpha/beta fold hydrolase [Streptomyces sp. NK08204]|uniref:alpha/beta fold hydrolase n=1 Tax=Streptomyces sp. NK08204 TaxID=2873260 RepID=UPI001CEC921F|nr:alpha/beta fold hydrolase [Streptomyces sp. NK08204]